MHDLSVAQMRRDLKARKYSARELTEHYLDRINQLGGALNAFVTVAAEDAVLAADRADKAIAAGQEAPLLGIPVAHKDIFCTRGLRTTAASRMLDNFVPPYSATAVEKIEAAGAITLGKTNMDEFAMGSSNENSYHGPVHNPWDQNFVPGGSSGGSAAAVAARLCAVATGTDTGGSIRQPAAFCGITGIKPTYGRVSRWGIIAYASSLDQAGAMARSAEDAALLLGAMAGYDSRDATSIDAQVPDYAALIGKPIDGLKIGICKAHFAQGLDRDSETLILAAIRELESQGARVSEIELPHSQYAIPAYYVIAPAECSANLSRYDGVRFGYRCEQPKDIEDLYTRSRSEGFGKEVKERIMVGAFALSTGYYDAYYKKAQQVRRLIRNDFARAFEQVDVIAGPVSPAPAFRLGAKVNDQIAMYLQDIYTISVNLAGLPAMSIPVGLQQGLPVGLQLIGNHLDEARLLQVGHAFQRETDWHLKAPGGAR